jgi:hypothetical protein
MDQNEIRYFATFDDDGFPTSFFPSDVWPEAQRPVEAVEISSEQYREFLAYPGERKWLDGEVVAGVPTPPLNQRITSAPDTLFGGPTIAQVLGET